MDGEPRPSGTTYDMGADEYVCTDVDGDDYAVDGGMCGPVDCDDNDNTVYPSATELCDGKDNDCDPATDDGTDETWFGDACDGADTDLCLEGNYICSDSAQACNDYSGNDLEVCDGVDNNCDNRRDEGCDEDDDELPDDWEYEFFDNLDEDSDGNPDRDAYTNLQEYERECDPTFTAITINVPGGYSTIQGAINNAFCGDLILVAPGTYT